ncbi:uncharacterized protein AKAME5_001967000 [Lates japonicus]|uniref:AIG1-type G domain-containing protein n=1 Tax=Lates japonicus TaxID=270547 RepID=A0AAD3RGY3_LATJO|nr:uncharacterized protein AKAME5_001967000 [Lates japonicus]
MSTEETPLFEKPPSDKESESELRIVLLGVVEEGKSSSGNMILSPSGGEKPFSTKCPPLAISRTIGRQRVVVVDTPDKNPDQVTDLLKKITHMIEMRRGTYYTTEMLQEAETALKQQQKQQQQQVQQQVLEV